MDSLLNQLNIHHEIDTTRLKILERITYQYGYSQPQEGLKYSEECIEVAKKLKKPIWEVSCWCNKGYLEWKLGNYDISLNSYSQALPIAQSQNDTKGLIDTYNGLGLSYWFKSDYPNALFSLEKSLELTILAKDSATMISVMSNLASLYLEIDNQEKAFEYSFKSMELAEKRGSTMSLAHTYGGLSGVYNAIKDYKNQELYLKKSMHYFKLAGDASGYISGSIELGYIQWLLKNYHAAIDSLDAVLPLAEETGVKYDVARIHQILGDCYRSIDNPKKSLHYLHQALTFFSETQDWLMMSSALSSLAKTYLSMQDYDNALKYAEWNLKIANKVKTNAVMMEVHESLAAVYKVSGRFQEAYEHISLQMAFKDSLMNENLLKSQKKLEKNFEIKKKETENELLRKDKELQQEKLDEQNTQLFALFVVIILASAFAFIFYWGRQKQKAINYLLEVKNEEINLQKESISKQSENLKQLNEELNTANEELLSVNEQLSQLNDLVVSQYQLISLKNRDLTDSIHYALQIQSAMLPFLYRIENVVGKDNFFILYKPRDVVSGDFYWFVEKNNRIFLTVSDCTGHGVPGAFMSVLGMSYLEEIILARNITRPDLVLNELHKGIRHSLKQDQTENQDGMDMVLIAFDKSEKKELLCAGAMNPLYYIENNSPTLLHDYKMDKKSIGGWQNQQEKAFDLHTITLSLPFTFYLCSDGYQDQFGGKKGKKFMAKRFKELLLSIHTKPMSKQQQIVENTLVQWMQESHSEQVDDITIMGVRLV
jgi:serine phosphatase RsbU (regulator of sigma subunit)